MPVPATTMTQPSAIFEKRATAADRLLHQRPGLFPCAIEAQDRQRIHLAVDGGNPAFQHVEQIERRDVAAVELIDD